MSYNYKPLEDVVQSWSAYNIPDSILIAEEKPDNNITMFAGGSEMLKVTQDGFYIRGVKVEQDDKEAERVYNAFKSFLMWAELNRN